MAQDIVDQVEKSTKNNPLLPQSVRGSDQTPGKPTNEKERDSLEQQVMKGRLNGDGASKSAKREDGVFKSSKNDDDSGKKDVNVGRRKTPRKPAGSHGSQVAGDSKRVDKEHSGIQGDNKKLVEEYRNISGVINWRKGYTLFDVDGQAARLLKFTQTLSDEKVGDASAQGRLDVLYGRLRAFGIFDVNIFKLTAKAGLGLQGALELVGAHIELKHDAPHVTLAGRDVSLHTIINGDAYAGIIGEAEATLNLDFNNLLDGAFLRLGGKAFAGAAASVSGSTSLGKLMSVYGSADAYAGVGGGAGVDIGLEDGKFKFSTGAGLAVALGAGYNVGFSVDIGEVAKLGDGIGKDLSEKPIPMVWDKNFPWPWKPDFHEVFYNTPEFMNELGPALGSNLGSIMHLLLYPFRPGRSDVPSEYSTKEERDITAELDEKKNRNTQPLA
jgi:hypothetical protein